jgi:hypothetical protein
METDEIMKEKSEEKKVEMNAFTEFRTNKTNVLTSNYSMNDLGRALDKDVILKQRELIAIMDKKIQELQLKAESNGKNVDKHENKNEIKIDNENEVDENENESIIDNNNDNEVYENDYGYKADMAFALKTISQILERTNKNNQSVREKNVNSAQQRFSGDKYSDDIDEWIETIDLNMESAHIRKENQIITVASFLHGNALTFYNLTKKNTSNLTWQMFKEILRKKFRPLNYQETLIDKISSLKQNENQLHKHIALFQKYANRIENISDGLKKKFFVDSLSEELKAKVNYADKNKSFTLNEAIDEARHIDECYRNSLKQLNSNENGKSEMNYLSANSNECHECGNRGHWRKDCALLRRNNYRRNERQRNEYGGENKYTNRNERQYNYGRNMNRNNEKQTSKYNNRNEKSNYDSNKGREELKCSFCGMSGHLYEKCFKRQREMNNNNEKDEKMEVNKMESRNEQNSRINSKPKPKSAELKVAEVEINRILVQDTALLTTHGSINNLNNQEFMHDTGANYSAISKQLQEKCKISLSDISTTVSLADGRELEIFFTDPIEVHAFDRTVSVQMIVLDIPIGKRQIILGLDWHTLTKAVLDIDSRCLYFKTDPERKAYYFDAIDEDEDNNEIETCNAIINEMDDVTDKEYDFGDPKDVCLKHLDNDMQLKVKDLLEEFKDIMATSIEDLSEPALLMPFQIITHDEKAEFLPIYRLNRKLREKQNQLIERMLKANIIQHSNSPWSAPTFSFPKKGSDEIRMVHDYRLLNSKTVKSRFPITRIDDVFANLANSTVFSTFDLKCSFHQQPIHPDSVAKTAFSTPDGHYEYLRLTMGVSNGPAEHTKALKAVFGNVKCTEIYIDDATVHSKDNEQHLNDLREFFTKCRERKLKVNKFKIKLMAKEISLLGHIITDKCIKMDPKKVEAVLNWPIPTNLTNVQQFLGLTGYYRYFIEQYAYIAIPLTDLQIKDVKFTWSFECDEAFKQLKKALTSYPILRKPDYSQPFILHTDASGVAIGAVLAQIDPTTKKEYVNGYYSRKKNKFERNLPVTESECLAAVDAIIHFKLILLESEFPFTLVTDHSALKWLMTKREPTGKLLRWVLFLQSMQFEVKHRAGKKHQNADALSRSVCVIEEIEINEANNIDPTEDQVLIEFLKNNRFDLGISNQKKKQILKIADKYKYENDILYFIKNDEFKIIPKIDQRYMLIEKSHILGHKSIADMYEILKKSFYWPKMMNQIEQYFKKCHVCCKHAKIRQNNHPALTFEQVNLAFDKVGIDLVFGLNQTAQGYKGVCVIYCYLSKYPFVRAIKSKEAPEIARVLFEFITLFGAPRELVSDQGTEFLNHVIKELTKIEYIDHLITSSYNPRCNGSVERYNQTFISTLTRLSDENPRNWPDYIQLTCMAYRTRQQSSTKFTPHELVFGKHHNDLIDYHQDMNANEELTLDLRLQQIGTQFKDFITKAKLNIDLAHDRQRNAQDSRNKIIDKLSKGSIVYIQTPELCRKKLEERFIGPYTVHAQSRRGNYWLLNEHNELLKHSYPINKLKISQRIEEEEYIMESIKGMRKINNIREFLVKWSGYPDEDNTWVKETEFTDAELLCSYL